MLFLLSLIRLLLDGGGGRNKTGEDLQPPTTLLILSEYRTYFSVSVYNTQMCIQT